MTQYTLTIIDYTINKVHTLHYVDREVCMEVWAYVERYSDRYKVVGFQEVTV